MNTDGRKPGQGLNNQIQAVFQNGSTIASLFLNVCVLLILYIDGNTRLSGLTCSLSSVCCNTGVGLGYTN